MFDTSLTTDFARSPERVYSAVETIVGADGHELLERDTGSGLIVFQTKKSLFSWGHVVTAQVTSSDGGARLALTVTAVPGAPRALLDGKKNRTMGQKVLDAVRDTL